jgi:hypothetical protein
MSEEHRTDRRSENVKTRSCEGKSQCERGFGVPVSAQSCMTSPAVLLSAKATESAQKSLASISRDETTSLCASEMDVLLNVSPKDLYFPMRCTWGSIPILV